MLNTQANGRLNDFQANQTNNGSHHSQTPSSTNGHRNGSAIVGDSLQIDPLQLPHANYSANSVKSTSSKCKYQTLSNQLDFKQKSNRQNQLLSSEDASRLNVDTICVLLWSSIAVCSCFVQFVLDPEIRPLCQSIRSFFILSSQTLIIVSIVTISLHLLVWHLLTKSRFYRKQTVFVLMTVFILILASTHAFWAVNSFFQPNCLQTIAILHKNKSNEFRIHLDFEIQNEINKEVHLNEDILNISNAHDEDDDLNLPIFGDRNDDHSIPITPTPSKENVASSTFKSNVLFDSNQQLFDLLIHSYDLKLIGVFHWAISLKLVAIALHLLAKRRRFAIELLKNRGLLVQYYWATMD